MTGIGRHICKKIRNIVSSILVAVCVMERWPSENAMMKLALENNLSETAFIVKETSGYHLRWFTPGTEEGFFPHHDAHDNNILQFWEVERIAGIRLADIALTY